MNNLISVCIVTCNRKLQLSRAIDSVINQAYSNIEIIVVDNNSDDGTSDLIKKKYPNIKYIKLHDNIGCPPARNIAMANAEGEFIANLDDDGVFDKNALANTIQVFRNNPNCGIVMMKIEEKNRIRKRELGKKTGDLLWSFSGGACVFRKKILQEVGYFEDGFFRQGEEYDYIIRLLEEGYDVRYSNNSIMIHKPVHRINNDYSIEIMKGEYINKTITLLRYAPIGVLIRRLLRRMVGNLYLFWKNGNLLTYMSCNIKIIWIIPELIRKRSVKKKGFEKFLKLKNK